MGYEIIKGDTLAKLRAMPDKSVDITVTSPPYNQLGSRIPAKGSGMFKEHHGWSDKVNAIGYADDMPEPEYQRWIKDVITECLRVSKGLVWINHKIRYRNKQAIHPLSFMPFPLYSEVVWSRGSSMALNCRKYAPSHEYIYGFGLPHYWDRQFDLKFSVWNIAAARGINHPCPFPVEIPRRLIVSSCPAGGTVLDPFCGSGSTGVAALGEGRNFVGIERVPEFCQLATERLQTAQGIDFAGVV